MSGGSNEEGAAVVSRYEVPSQRQSELVSLLEEHLRRWICHRPGFVSSSVLRSIDERHVVVCTKWRQVNDGVNYMDCEEGSRLLAALSKSGAKERESHTYHLSRPVSREDA